jgi:hypothetical protein
MPADVPSRRKLAPVVTTAIGGLGEVLGGERRRLYRPLWIRRTEGQFRFLFNVVDQVPTLTSRNLDKELASSGSRFQKSGRVRSAVTRSMRVRY